MELTLKITDSQNLKSLIELLDDLSYVEIVDMKGEEGKEIPESHKALLTQRLKRIEKGQTTFKSWEAIKEKYETGL